MTLMKTRSYASFLDEIDLVMYVCYYRCLELLV